MSVAASGARIEVRSPAPGGRRRARRGWRPPRSSTSSRASPRAGWSRRGPPGRRPGRSPRPSSGTGRPARSGRRRSASRPAAGWPTARARRSRSGAGSIDGPVVGWRGAGAAAPTRGPTPLGAARRLRVGIDAPRSRARTPDGDGEHDRSDDEQGRRFTGPMMPRAQARAERRPVRAGGRGVREMRVMADPTGFEPAISSVTGWHVGPLHHGSSCGECGG